MSKKIESYMFNMCMIHDLETNKIVIQDKQNSDWKGLTFPGGKIEHGESFIESTIREVHEETGLIVSNLKPCGTINWYNTENHERWLVFLYKTSEYTGILLDETREGKVYWCDRDEIASDQWAPNMETYLKLFNNENVNEAFATWDSQSQSEFRLL